MNGSLKIIATVAVDYDIIDLELQKREILSSTTLQML
jgi:lactate dehydrogenase-like 2-hydroxyacid dehydrogenase